MIKRAIFESLKTHLSKKEISFIIGPRQAGKTTLMRHLKDDVEKHGGKTVFLNLDIEADKQFFSSQEHLIKKILLEIGKEKGVVFIDEIQRKDDAGVFLKGIYDMNLPYKFVVSGSGSVELKEKLHESLVGRKRIFELSTVSFEEFVNFTTGYKYEGKLTDFFSLDTIRTRALLEEYLNFGGYPRVVLEDILEEKKRFIDEIYQSYLEKDISYLLNIRKTESFSNVLRLISGQAGSLVNFSELSSTGGLSVTTVKNYLWYLEKTFILHKVTPYFRNLRKEITKSPVYYFYDLGLRNYTLGVFGQVKRPQDSGFLFQNFVFNALKETLRESSATIHYWRTKDGAEVDFVIRSGLGLVPIEAKYKELRGGEVTRSLRSFIERYRPEKAYIINLGPEKTQMFHTTHIHFLSFYKLTAIELPAL